MKYNEKVRIRDGLFVPSMLLPSEKEGSSGMLCVGPDGAKPGPRSAL